MNRRLHSFDPPEGPHDQNWRNQSITPTETFSTHPLSCCDSQNLPTRQDGIVADRPIAKAAAQHGVHVIGAAVPTEQLGGPPAFEIDGLPAENQSVNVSAGLVQKRAVAERVGVFAE